MSNIKKNYFNPGANQIGISKLPITKVDSTFNPTYQKKLSKRTRNTLNINKPI